MSRGLRGSIYVLLAHLLVTQESRPGGICPFLPLCQECLWGPFAPGWALGSGARKVSGLVPVLPGARGTGVTAVRADTPLQGSTSPLRAQPQSLLFCRVPPDSLIWATFPHCMFSALHLIGALTAVTSWGHAITWGVAFPLD